MRSEGPPSSLSPAASATHSKSDGQDTDWQEHKRADTLGIGCITLNDYGSDRKGTAGIRCQLVDEEEDEAEGPDLNRVGSMRAARDREGEGVRIPSSADIK